MVLGGLKILLNLMKIKKGYNEESDERYFLEFDIQYLESLHNLHHGYHFYPKE